MSLAKKITKNPTTIQLMNPPIIIGSIFEKFKLEKSNISVSIEPSKNAIDKVIAKQIKETIIVIIIFAKIGFLLKSSPHCHDTSSSFLLTLV